MNGPYYQITAEQWAYLQASQSYTRASLTKTDVKGHRRAMERTYSRMIKSDRANAEIEQRAREAA